jgi:uncharacterized protein (TIGR02284 family)
MSVKTGSTVATSQEDIFEIEILLSLTLDSIKAYSEAHDKVSGSHFSSLFGDRITERQPVVAALRNELGRLGGVVPDIASNREDASGLFAGVPEAAIGYNSEALVDQIERCEDHVLTKFEKAMNNPRLSPQTARVIHDCYPVMKQGYDRMRDIRQAMEGGR